MDGESGESMELMKEVPFKELSQAELERLATLGCADERLELIKNILLNLL